MRVLHIIPSLSPKHGGPSFAIRAIARALANVDVDVTIATTDDNGNDARFDVALDTPIREEGATIFYFRRDILPYKISFGLARWLNQKIAEFDIVHIHALFSFSSTVAARAARRHRRPYIVRPLGVLNRWGLQNRRSLAKRVSLALIERPILRHAAAIHYTSEAEELEAMAISNEFANERSAVIPLPVESTGGEAADFLGRYPKLAGRRLVLFLSRIDRKKGLELLLDSFPSVQREVANVTLVIAGNGTSQYVKELQQRAAELRVADAVLWPGHLSGLYKSGAFAAADVFVLPSHSENFGIAAGEALAAGVPTIVSENVAIAKDINHYDAGIVVPRDQLQLSRAIIRVLRSPEESERISKNGTRLVKEKYSPKAIGAALRELYSACKAIRETSN